MKSIRGFEFRALENEAQEMILEGYPIVFESPATHGFTEVIDRHALDNCDLSDVPLKYNHEDSHLIMARTRNGSLKLEIDSVGLKMTAKLIDTQSNRDIYASVKAGLIDKMSFAFSVRGDEYDYDTDTRRITDIERLFDVSVVDLPFYDATSVSARSFDDDFMAKVESEKRQRILNEMERKELLARL